MCASVPLTCGCAWWLAECLEDVSVQDPSGFSECAEDAEDFVIGDGACSGGSVWSADELCQHPLGGVRSGIIGTPEVVGGSLVRQTFQAYLSEFPLFGPRFCRCLCPSGLVHKTRKRRADLPRIGVRVVSQTHESGKFTGFACASGARGGT